MRPLIFKSSSPYFDVPEALLLSQDLRANTWHEFKVVALTAAGAGLASQASLPVLTQVGEFSP